MLYISLGNGKDHILDSLTPSPEGRVVTTVCGQSHPETDFTSSTEDDSNVCARCAGKVDLEPEVVVEYKPEVKDTKSQTEVKSK